MPSRSRRSSSATGCSSPSGAPRRRSPAARRAGFTLLEVLVALAVLGIGLGVVFQGIAQGLRVRGAAGESARLSLVTERILGAVAARAAAPERPEEGEDGGCRWRLETVSGRGGWTGGRRAGAAAEGAAGLVEVRLTVTGPSGLAWEMTTLLPPGEKAAP